MTTISQQFSAVTLMKIFEEEVIDKRTGENDYIVFDISIQDGQFIAQHIPMTDEQSESDKIAFVSIDIDEDFSLDENLSELYTACIEAIINSEYFTLKD